MTGELTGNEGQSTRSIVDAVTELRGQLTPRLTELGRVDGAVLCSLGAGRTRRYLEAARARNLYVYAAEQPRALAYQWRRLEGRVPREVLRDLNRLALATLLAARLDDPALTRSPAGIVELELGWFRRLLGLLERTGDDLDFTRDDGSSNWELRFDFAVAAGRMVPVGGAWVVERRRLPRAALLPAVPSADAPTPGRRVWLWRAARRGAGLFRMDGLLERVQQRHAEQREPHGTYLVIHTAHQYRRWFSERHQATAFRNIAELLCADPGIEGLYRKSWFLDPQVSAQQPRMKFLLDPVSLGARYGRVGPISVEDQRQILDFSAARRAHYGESDYRPEVWAYLWPRDGLLAWAARAQPVADGAAPASEPGP